MFYIVSWVLNRPSVTLSAWSSPTRRGFLGQLTSTSGHSLLTPWDSLLALRHSLHPLFHSREWYHALFSTRIIIRQNFCLLRENRFKWIIYPRASFYCKEADRNFYFFLFLFSISFLLRVSREENLEVEEIGVSYKWTPREPGEINTNQFQEFSEWYSK